MGCEERVEFEEGDAELCCGHGRLPVGLGPWFSGVADSLDYFPPVVFVEVAAAKSMSVDGVFAAGDEAKVGDAVVSGVSVYVVYDEVWVWPLAVDECPGNPADGVDFTLEASRAILALPRLIGAGAGVLSTDDYPGFSVGESSEFRIIGKCFCEALG